MREHWPAINVLLGKWDEARGVQETLLLNDRPFDISDRRLVLQYHQYQREVKKDKHGQLYIDVNYEDIEQGFYFMKDVLFSKSDELTKATREFFEKLKEYVKEKQLVSFKTQDIRKAFRMEPRTIQRYVKELSQYGYIKRISGQKGRIGFEYTIVDAEEYNKLQTAIDGHIEEVLKSVREFIQSGK